MSVENQAEIPNQKEVDQRSGCLAIKADGKGGDG
jgi:hypothetical protein